MRAIKQLLELKSDINTRELRFRRLKAKKSIEENREAIQHLRRSMADIIYDNYDKISLEIEKISDKNPHAFCVMAMVGGPMHTPNPIHAYKCGFGSIQVVHDCYVGVIHLIDDKCGMDNLKILANNK